MGAETRTRRVKRVRMQSFVCQFRDIVRARASGPIFTLADGARHPGGAILVTSRGNFAGADRRRGVPRAR
jgi:hypothetical protein